MAPMLFTPLRIRELTFKNRIFVSPMCQYSAVSGVPNAWHMVHLGSRAVGGAALVLAEATSVSPEGRISPADTGLWNDEQEGAFAKIAEFVREQQSCVLGIQLAHAGRKASTPAPWIGSVSEPWPVVGPSPVAFSPDYAIPHELTRMQIDDIVAQFVSATARSQRAGFQVVEIHMAHGYLLHEFLSPQSNHRTDDFGGSLENRMRFPLQVAAAVRTTWPAILPVFVRISATDWLPDGAGWTATDSIALAQRLRELGVDLIDCSTGGNVPHVRIPVGPGYQVGFAESVRREAGILTGAVGMITDPKQAEDILRSGRADAVLLAREMLRDPYWPLHAARTLGVEVEWPKQYDRAKG